MTIHLIVGLITKTFYKNELNAILNPFGGNVNVQVDLSKYVTNLI